jgi:hypothetical protein
VCLILHQNSRCFQFYFDSPVLSPLQLQVYYLPTNTYTYTSHNDAHQRIALSFSYTFIHSSLDYHFVSFYFPLFMTALHNFNYSTTISDYWQQQGGRSPHLYYTCTSRTHRYRREVKPKPPSPHSWNQSYYKTVETHVASGHQKSRLME